MILSIILLYLESIHVGLLAAVASCSLSLFYLSSNFKSVNDLIGMIFGLQRIYLKPIS